MPPPPAPDLDPVGRARRLADDLLRPAAERVDRTVVPRSHLDAWAEQGLLGLAGPRAYGGAQAPPAVLREVAEVLAGACGATWFVATQHTMPLTSLAASGNEDLRRRHRQLLGRQLEQPLRQVGGGGHAANSSQRPDPAYR